MIAGALAVLLCFLCVSSWTSASPKLISECEQKAHRSLNPAQRRQLCETTTTGEYSVGPAVCSVYAKDKLRLSAEELIALCIDAPSSAPAECWEQVDRALQKRIGHHLCARVESTLPAECVYELFQSLGVPKLVENAKKKTIVDSIVSFCHVAEDRASLECVRAVRQHSKLSETVALERCAVVSGSGDSSRSNALNEVVSSCIASMMPHTRTTAALQPEQVLDFCVQVNHRQYPEHLVSANIESGFATAAVDCFDSLRLWSSRSSVALSPTQQLAICQNAPLALGPVNCSLQAIESTRSREPHLKLTGDQIGALCGGATSSGPAECFAESKGIASIEERLQLCHGAVNAGPAACYRRANNVFRNDVENKMLLCVMAASEGPAACASKAPPFLAAEEKINLCADAPAQYFQDPIRCLQAVQAASKLFAKAPKKALGYPQENIQLDSDWTSRGLVLSMCSYSDSQHPIASAECFKSVPTSLDHDDAVLMCTNVSSSDVVQHMQLCHRILPNSWSSDAVRALCDNVESRTQAESVVKCAVEMSKLSGLPLNQLDVAHLCATDTQAAHAVYHCVRKLRHALPQSSPYLTNSTLQGVCRHASTTDSADCLIQVHQMTSSTRAFDTALPQRLCTRTDFASILTCLDRQTTKRLITQHDVQRCSDEKRVPTTVRMKRLISGDGDGGNAITAGRPFAMWFEVLDQYGQRYQPPMDETTGQPTLSLFKASINEQNPQGAVLWGIRLNNTVSGELQFNSLVISQPGLVEFKLAVVDGTQARDSATVLTIIKVNVQIDERLQQAAPCLHLLQHTQCPADSREDDWLSLFPMTRSFSASTEYLRNIMCSSPDALESWKVNAHLNSNGALWISYRNGIDSIWTGVGLPRLEMNAGERLDVHVPTDEQAIRELNRKNKRQIIKIIKRGYYKASLQWHPDRWSGLDQYQPAVQGVFQLISEAYEQLMALYGGSSADESV